MIYNTAQNNNEFPEFSRKFLRLQVRIVTHTDGDFIKLILLSYIVARGKIAFFDCENRSREVDVRDVCTVKDLSRLYRQELQQIK